MRNHQLIQLHFTLRTFWLLYESEEKEAPDQLLLTDKPKHTDVTTMSLLFHHCICRLRAALTLIPQYQYFSFTTSGGAFNHIVLKESTLTYITMLINRTFPFCRRPQRATLSVSVAESPHSLGPIHVFPMLQFTHWIRPGPKKSVSVPIIIWQGGEAVWQGWGVRYLSLFTSAALFPLFLSLRE